MDTEVTRRRFLKALGASGAYLALTNAVGCDLLGRASKLNSLHPPKISPLHPTRVWPLSRGSSASPTKAFRSRPDLSPPAAEVTTRAHHTAPGYIFIAPERGGTRQGGPMIVDDHGQVVWFRPVRSERLFARDFKVQHYRGEPVLTWWEGFLGYPLNEYVIADGSYREITRIRAGNGRSADHHEFLITPRDTALIIIYDTVRRDLSPVGGLKDGLVWQGIVQELDIETRKVLFEWHSLEHVGLDETYATPPNDALPGIDYFHLNSIDIDHDSNLLISARETFTVYKIDRKSGEIIWRLGGKKSDFEMGEGTRFAYQHDARRHKDGTLTIFDNGSTIFPGGVPRAIEESRGIVLELDEDKMAATLVREYTHPEKQFADAGGNMQVLPNGDVFFGWGRALAFSEFSKDGELLFDANLPPENNSYRAFRFPWKARPADHPAVAVERRSDKKVTIYASWNGATEVASWEVLCGPRPEQLESLGSVAREGFETAMLAQASDDASYVAVRAKDRSGEILGASAPVEL